MCLLQLIKAIMNEHEVHLLRKGGGNERKNIKNEKKVDESTTVEREVKGIGDAMSPTVTTAIKGKNVQGLRRNENIGI
jgi:hypothetical protein